MRFRNISKQFFSIGLLFIIVSISSVYAQSYYADLTINVDEYGFVTIQGVTNYPNLLEKNTENYTSKKQSYWSLNITKEENFTDFIYALTLPEGSSINYIKSSGSIRIEENLGKLIVKGLGENEPLSIQVQYQIEKSSEIGSIKFDFISIILIAVVIFLIVIFFIIILRGRSNPEEIKVNGNDFKGLNQRQKQIMKLLIDNKTPLTQTDIQKMLGIPKAAVSRNVRTLELKGLIEKEQIGMSNLIRLKNSKP